ncbi:MAG: type IX secretion system sortase PorU [Bacteroidales bacterium]
MRLVLTFFLLSVFSFLSAQSWYYKREIKWENPVSVNKNVDFKDLVSFKDSYYEDFNSIFPHYFENIPWNRNIKKLNLSLYNVEAESVDPESVPVDYMKRLSEDFQLKFYKASEKGRDVIQYSLVPFRINKNSGELERIKSFILQADVIEDEGYSKKERSFNTDSPLSTGEWFKVRISEEGIHKISWSQLSEMGLSNPQNVKIYGYGGERLPENPGSGRQDEFIEVPVYLNKGSDGIFNSGDYLLFFALGTVEWNYNVTKAVFEHDKNPYTDYGYYFITSGNEEATIPSDIELADEPADYTTQSYDALLFHEKDEVNLIESGQEWYGELFDITTQRTFSFEVPGLETGSDVYLITNLLGRAKTSSSFTIYANNQILDTASIRSTDVGNYVATYAFTSSEVYAFNTNSENIDIRLQYNKPDATAQGWLDFLALNARSSLSLRDGQLIFRDKESLYSSVTEYSLSNASSETQVWEISAYPEVKNVPGTLEGNNLKFSLPGGDLKEFVAFNPTASFPSVVFEGEGLGRIENQNIKGSGFPDLVIVSYPEFLPQAERMAEYRRDHSGMDVVVVTPMQIYNEFSSGRPDVTAIRDYMSWLYQEAGEDDELKPQYLLLFGDGSYIFKSNDPVDGNFVPTYQSKNSLSPVQSFVSDDFFGLLDEDENISSGLLDIGIGRFPVSTIEEATLMVDKVIKYESPESMGEWRNSIVFIGDDEDSNIHFGQADELARTIEENYPAFNVNKIYLDAYPQVGTSVGERYPAVNEAINNQVNRGALIVNYTGHGGTKGLAEEQILGINDIQSWNNKGKLPLFMTATCEFSRFDKPDIVSAGELVILSPESGGIALFTTTRLVYSAPNHVLNRKFYEIVFEKDEDGRNYCLGDIMKYSKNNGGFGINKRNFSLLGDPAMRLTYPFHDILVDSINMSDTNNLQDTLKALTQVRIAGFVRDYSGKKLDNFNGVIYPTVYDKASEQSTLANDEDSYQSPFTIRNTILYKGKATVNSGRFEFSFIVPKDINYAYGTGKMSFYAEDSLLDASGAFQNIIVGGSSPFAEPDNTGPEVEVYMNNEYFLEGGITDSNPVLFVKVFDENGINTTGNGIGHDITATLNGNTQNKIVLNEYYQSELDSYQAGAVSYPLFNLEEGRHLVEVKVWDIYNNSAEGFTEFVVVKSDEMLLENLMNYPNPFRENTYFSFEHNKSDQNLEVTIDIFDMRGSLVRTIKAKEYGSGYRSKPIYWDGRSESGNYNRQGVYIYRIRVKSSDGEEAVKSGRLIILR